MKTQQTNNIPRARLGCCLALLLAGVVPGLAQTAAPAIDAQTLAKYDLNKNGVLEPDELAALHAEQAKLPAKDEMVVMNPFEVHTEKDTSYGAVNSNAIAAFSMELLKAPVAADIFTEQFMNDVGTTTVEDLLNGYGAGVGQVLATPESDSNNNQPGDRFSVAQVGSRGLTAGATRRDGFSAASTRTSITDTFDTERVEVIKGPNALLFGASGAGGFANTGSKTAKFGSDGRPNTGASVTSRIDQYGSKRWVFDANYGVKDIAFRFVALDEDQNYRRIYIGAKTHAYYGSLAARLPFQTLLKVNARKTDNNRIIPTRGDNLSFTNATRDPRHNFSLMYLLATNQAGATDPKTGAAYPAGPVVNGKLDWDNASSWSGWTQSEDINTETYTLTAETVWARWLATSLGAFYEHTKSQRGPDGGSLMAPRAFNSSNPFLNGEWANGSTFRMDRNAGKKHAYRASALITNDLFNGRVKSQTVLGYDLNFSSNGNVNYRYYEADGNFNVYDLSNPRPAGIGPTAGGTSSANQLGRYELGTIYWPVSDGPQKKPYFRIGTRQITVAGKNYVLLQQNPRNPNFVTPLNPLGLVTFVPGFTGVGGANLGNYASDNKDYGIYAANYAKWFDERITTLVGYRKSHTFSRDPNTSASGTQAYNDTLKSNSSYNLGLTYQIRPWLNAYYNIGQTFDPAKGSPDPYGNPPPDTEGFSQEVGLKYQLLDGRISGSMAYYRGESKHENFNYGTGNRDLINPVGINDAYNAGTRNQWVALDKESSGIEVILTAHVTRGWNSRLGFTQQNGRIKSASAFPLLWNDEFYYNKSTGGVTYSDGTPFTVPTDAAGVSTVSSTNGLRTAVVGATNTQLTVAMMSDKNSDYYAYGKGGNTQSNGRIVNNSVLFRALRWFQTPAGLQARTLNPGRPFSAIPYFYDDPSGLKGIAVLSASGEPTIGHPLYRFVWTNSYAFTESRLRGLTAGTTIRWDHDKRTYWYTEPDGKGGNIRKLYKEVELQPIWSTFLRYSRKIGRYGFTTQVNIDNMFNTYKVDLRPSGTNGYTVENEIGATFVGEPRTYSWTNSIAF
jgi:outer membrane receptor protein involved in Fe transport